MEKVPRSGQHVVLSWIMVIKLLTANSGDEIQTRLPRLLLYFAPLTLRHRGIALRGLQTEYDLVQILQIQFTGVM